jgi:hypothetical protein
VTESTRRADVVPVDDWPPNVDVSFGDDADAGEIVFLSTPCGWVMSVSAVGIVFGREDEDEEDRWWTGRRRDLPNQKACSQVLHVAERALEFLRGKRDVAAKHVA